VRLRLISLAAGAALAVTGCGSGNRKTTTTVPSPGGHTASPAAAVRATNDLAVGLLQRLPGSGGNVVFSPYSVQAALAMVDAGAAGETAVQIGHVLGSSSASVLGASNGALADRLAAAASAPSSAPAKDAARLSIANSLWVSSRLSLMQSFSHALSEDFGAIPQTTDFASQPEAARQSINNWVASHTANIIKDLMPPGSVNPQTVLVLANAVYLKAHWSSPFDPRSTAPGEFVTLSGARVRVPFMTQTSTKLGYAAGDGFVEVDLPYLYTDLSMLAIMPRAGTLASFEHKLTAGRMTALTQLLGPRTVNLRMPRLHLAAQEQLNVVLASLGMPIAFSDRADFSGIASGPRVTISTVQHGADLKVDEQGTVAAAATGLGLAGAAAPSKPANVTLDHPFLLFLRDDQSGAILFAGRVANPART
jgi:serpin B